MSSPENDHATLVLTRPRHGAERMLAQVEAEYGQPVRSILSPMIQIERVGAWPILGGDMPLIITSPNAVLGKLNGQRVFCVGQRTAEAVRAQGGQVVDVQPDAQHLLNVLVASKCKTFTYLRGTHVASDLAQLLGGQGITCREHVVYDQRALPLSEEARRAIEGELPVILPLLSDRSARLIGDSITLLGSRLHVIAMSAGISETWRATTGGSSDVAATPTGDVMVNMIVAALQRNLP